MSREACIQTYCRLAPVLPSPAPVPTLRIAVEDHGTGRSTLVAADPVTGACTSLGCAGVLRPTASQLEVFETVARPLLERVLFDDEKCAVLAYGQTASGKTHTVLGPKGGSPEFFGDDAMCGLLPRAVDYFFSVSSSAPGSVMPRSSLSSAPGDRQRNNGGGNYSGDSYGMDEGSAGGGGGQGQGDDDDGEPLLCDGVEISAVEIYNETATDLVAKCHVDATIAAANSSKKNSGGASGGGGGVRGRSPSTSASFSSLASSATSSFASYRGGSRDSSPTNRGHGGSTNSGPGSHVQVQYKATEKGKLLRSVRQARCRTLTDAHETIAALCRSRCTAATDANSVSSRSHVVVQVTPLLRPTGAAVSRRAGTATFVDLAGSECLKNLRDGGSSTSAADEFDADGVAASHRITGGAFAGTGPRGGGGGIGGGSGVLQEMHETSRREQRQRETRRINVSLLALKKVVHALHRGAAFVPFMESLLTVVLEPCLGRHAAALVACCSPRIVDSAETLETLRFAAEASKIRARPQSSARLAVERSLARAVKSRDRVASAAASAARKKGGHGAFELVDDDDVCSPARPGHGDDFGAGGGSKLQKEADHMVMVYGSPERYESPSPGHGSGGRRAGDRPRQRAFDGREDSVDDYDDGLESEGENDEGFDRFEREAFADIVRHSGGGGSQHHPPALHDHHGSRIQRRQPGERHGAAPSADMRSVQMAPESLPSPSTPGAPAAQLTLPSTASGRPGGPASQGPQGFPATANGPLSSGPAQDATHRLFAAEDAGRLRRENTELKIELSSVRRELEDGRAAAARLLAQCSRLAEGVSVMEGERNEALDSLHRERAENANAIANAKAEADAAIAQAEETAAKVAPAPHTPSSTLIATPLFATPASKTSAQDQHHQSSLAAAHVEEMARMKSAMTALEAEKADAVSALEMERQVSATLRRDVAALQAMLGHEDPRHASDGESKGRHHDHSRSHMPNDVEIAVKKEQHVASEVQRGDTPSSVVPPVPSPSAHPPPQPARPTLVVANDDASVIDEAPPSLLDLSRSSAAPSSVPSSAAHRRRDDGSRGFVRRDRERSLSPSGEGHHYFREPEHHAHEPDMEDRRGAAQNANDKTFGLEDLAACVEGTAGSARRRSPSPSGEGHHYFHEPMPSTLTSTSAATRTMGTLMQPSTSAPKAAVAKTAGPAFDIYVDPAQSERSMTTPTSQHRDSQPSSAAVNNGNHRTQDREHSQQTLQQRSVNEMNQRSSTKPRAPVPQEKPAPKRYGGSAAAMERMLLLERLRKSSTVSDLMAHDRDIDTTKDDDSSAARQVLPGVHTGHRADGRDANSSSLLARVTDSEADDETAGGEVDLSASSYSLLVGETPGKERPTFSI